MIYLDSGATTLEKPPAVARAMAQAVGGDVLSGTGKLSGLPKGGPDGL